MTALETASLYYEAWTNKHGDPDADIIHSSVVYFIDPRGRERYLASPQAGHTSSGASYLPPGQIAAWGRGIAQLAGVLAA